MAICYIDKNKISEREKKDAPWLPWQMQKRFTFLLSRTEKSAQKTKQKRPRSPWTTSRTKSETKSAVLSIHIEEGEK